MRPVRTGTVGHRTLIGSLRRPRNRNTWPLNGYVFVFRGRRGDKINVLWWSGDRLCVLAKRLERSRFVWPQAASGSVALRQAQLSMLLEGIDRRRPERTGPDVGLVHVAQLT